MGQKWKKNEEKLETMETGQSYFKCEVCLDLTHLKEN